MSGLRLAVTTLSVLPVRGDVALDRRTAGRAMELAPLVGLAIGLVAGAVAFAVRVAGAPPFLAAVVAVAALAAVTRGLHLDGLADLTDGLASYRDPEGTRAVMKKPDVGPLGISALVLLLAAQVAALTSAIGQHRGTLSLLLAVVVGRVAITAACAGTPAATPDGMGALVAGTVRRGVPTAWALVTAGVFAAALALDPDATGRTAVRAGLAVGAVAAGLAAARVLRLHAVRRVGGLTGDVLGALSEVATTTALVVLALGAG
jgi:adenosylcobinamide-GDP ribazoletransferase